MQPEIMHEDERFVIAVWKNVCIIDAWGEIDLPRMRKMGDCYRKLLARHPQGILAISSLRPNIPVSGSDARAESVSFLKELGDKLLHLAFVIEADGVLGLMLRSVLRGINALVRPGRIVIVESVERAVQIVSPHVASDLRRDDVQLQLTAAIAGLRARFKGPLRSASPTRSSL